MKIVNAIRLQQVSIIPWDAGRPMLGPNARKVDSAFIQLGYRKLISTDPSGHKVLYYTKRFAEYRVFSHIFADGMAMFFVLPPKMRFHRQEDFDPDVANLAKWQHHKVLLDSHSSVFGELLSARRSIWKAVSDDRHKMRQTASEDWEKRGVSYVFSVFVASYASSLDSFMSKNLPIILCPRRRMIEESTHQFDDIVPISGRVTTDDIDPLLFREEKDHKFLYSWSTAICAGRGHFQTTISFIKIIADVQKLWYSLYSFGSEIEYIESRIERYSSYSEVVKFSTSINKMHRLALSGYSMETSMASELEVAEKEKLWRASKLQDVYDGLKLRAQLLRGELSMIAEKKRSDRLKVLEMILVVFTIIQGLSAYVELKNVYSTMYAEISVVIAATIVVIGIIWVAK